MWLCTFGVVFDNEHRGGYRWFLRARAHHFRGPFWWYFWGVGPVGPTFIINYYLESKMNDGATVLGYLAGSAGSSRLGILASTIQTCGAEP